MAARLRRLLPAAPSAQRLVVGLSGGRDSICLLSALKELQPDFGYGLAACHVNHGISSHAAEWQTFCQRFCDISGIPLKAVQISVPLDSAEGLEAAARTRRYAVFADIDADWLVLGQHRGDQAETLLFNLLRGSGVHGARAMPEVRILRPGLLLLRPLLGVPRTDIERYLGSRTLHWIEDDSNGDQRFSRNFLRHRIIPELQSRFPATEERLALSAERFAEAAVLLDDLALIDLSGAPAAFPVALDLLASLSEARARNLLRFLLARQGVGIPGETRFREALRQLLDAREDRHPSIVFGNWRLFRKRGEVRLEKIHRNEGRH